MHVKQLYLGFYTYCSDVLRVSLFTLGSNCSEMLLLSCSYQVSLFTIGGNWPEMLLLRCSYRVSLFTIGSNWPEMLLLSIKETILIHEPQF